MATCNLMLRLLQGHKFNIDHPENFNPQWPAVFVSRDISQGESLICCSFLSELQSTSTAIELHQLLLNLKVQYVNAHSLPRTYINSYIQNPTRRSILTVVTNTCTNEVRVVHCKSVHHHTIPINHPTRCNSFPSLLLDVYVRLNVFRASSRPTSGAQQL